MEDSPSLSSHTTAPPSLTPIHTTSRPVQTEIGLSDLSATDYPLVGQDPLSQGGEIILEGDSSLDKIEILRMSSPRPLNRGDGSLPVQIHKQGDCLTSLPKHHLKERVLLKLILNHFEAKLVPKNWLLASLLMLGQHMLDQLQA